MDNNRSKNIGDNVETADFDYNQVIVEDVETDSNDVNATYMTERDK